MAKIKVENPVVELDGDEMTRIIWAFIKDKLILPYLDVDLKYYDLGIEHRDATDDQVTIDAANAIKQHGVGVKCATITPDEARVEEFGLKKMWRSPNGTIRNILGGVVFREPIICSNIPRLRAGLDQADRHRPSRPRRPVQGDRLQGPRPRHGHHHLHAADGGEPDRARGRHVHDGGGVAMGMYNFDDSIRDFARASLRYGLERELPGVPVDEEHDPQGLRRRVQGPLPGGVRRRVQGPSSTAPASRTSTGSSTTWWPQVIKWEGGYVWACKNYDGDVQSDTVAQGFGSLGPDDVGADDAGRPDVRGRGRPRHGHPPLPPAPAGREDVHQPDRVDLRLDPGPRSSGAARTARPTSQRFAETLERVCVETVESGQMTKDLALLIGKDQPFLTTEEFLDSLDAGLQSAMA